MYAPNQPLLTDSNAVLEALTDARQELLDLGLRNTLLNYRLLRSRGVEVVDARAADVFSVLVTKGTAMSFNPKPEDPASDGLTQGETDKTANASVKTASERSLQTNHNAKDLDKRLINSFYLARTSIEEQGVSVLYMALGMLHWYEADSSEDLRRAPIMLIPVRLERSTGKSGFQVVYTGEDIGENLSLREKLESEFGITTPSLPDLEDLDLAQHFSDWERTIADQERWKISRHEIALGFFSFGKFLMYRDLDPNVWPETRQPQNHPIVSVLLGEGFLDSASGYSEDQYIDTISEVMSLHQVVDADSSQTLAILEASSGRNLVIQGPPGTGKSQTITNIIAGAIASKKTVLFVSEKMAALEVVKQNLDKIGVGDACLELHSNKTNKRELLQELQRTLDLNKPKARDLQSAQTLLQHERDRLNSYCEAVNTQVGETGIRPQQAYGYRLTLESRLPEGVRYPPMNIAGLSKWTPVEFEQRSGLVAQLQAWVAELGSPKDHPLYGISHTSLGLSTQDQIARALDETLKSHQTLCHVRNQLASSFDLPLPTSLEECRRLVREARAIGSAPEKRPSGLASQDWHANREALFRLFDVGSSRAAIRSKWIDTLRPEAWESDVASLHQDLTDFEHKWWRGLSGRYRAARKQLDALCESGAPANIADQAEVVHDIIASQDMSRKIGQREQFAQDHFGSEWQGVTSDWETLKDQTEWAATVHADVREGKLSPAVLNALAAGATDDGLAATLEAAINHYEDRLNALLSALAFDSDQTGWTPAQLISQPLDDQFQTVKYWSDHRNDITQILDFNRIANECRNMGMDTVVDLATEWEQVGNLLQPAFEYARYTAIIDRASSERDVLSTFTRSRHESDVNSFRKHDTELFENRRIQVATTHWDGLPKHQGGGQMSVLRHEFGKKTRHLPIRQLIAKSGKAVQAIKPVFMMSPMSIATYLPPESITFDMVIFDEASQVPPADALGALLRGQQAIVVGDSKQLPPTHFFNVVTQGDDDGDDNSSTRDLESILGLFTSKNVQQKMLRWHYRSRHESLIAVSNHEFYDSKLLVFPSPYTDRSQLGLVFHHLPHAHYDRGGTRANPIEARTVAEAVADHARRCVQTGTKVSLGVATFSAAQADAIRDQLEILRSERDDLREFLDDTGFESFFIKNLENVQGDERDVIFISVGYGPDNHGRFYMNFGPLNSDGGERRLNVLITRARQRCEVFSSITADDIDLNRSQTRGVRAFKQFLKYAETGSLGGVPLPSGRAPASPFEEAVYTALVEAGYQLEAQVGHEGYFIDLAVVDPARPGRYIIAIECDGATYHSARSARDRDRLRQSVLEGLGWTFHRIWSTDWFKNPERELQRTIEAIEEARAHIDLPTEPEPIEELTTTIERQPQSPSDAPVESRTRYRRARVTLPPCSLDLHERSLDDLIPAVIAVVAVESPVHVDEIARRIMEAAGVKRLGNRIRDRVQLAVRSASAQGQVVRRGNFIWIPLMADPPVRDRSNETGPLKSIEMIAPEEIQAAIIEVVLASFEIERDEAISLVGSRLGFQRVKSATRQTINRMTDHLVKRKKLTERDQYLSMPR